MSDPLPQINQSIIPINSTIIIGLSGGPDSIYLLYKILAVASSLNIKIIAAHLDHEWQESSKIAAAICQETCQSLGVDLIIKKISELKFKAKWNGSQEELGRKMRRYFFESILQEHQASAIALAHHRQDQHETFFIRLIRGTSLQGLTGIQEKDKLYIRPILQHTKQEILTYLQTHKIFYYSDPTNTSDNYLRNKIRNHVITALQKTDIRFEQNLTTTMNHLRNVHDFLEQQTQLMLTNIKTKKGIKILPFLSLHNIIQQKIVLTLLIEEKIFFTPSQKLFKEILRFLEKSSANQHIIYESCCIKKNKSYFFMKKIEKSDKNL